MNWGDAVTAFQQGTVDGQENPIAILLAVRIYQYHKYLTDWNYLIDPLVLYWNRKEWEEFSPSIRKALRAAAGEAARYEKALVRAGLDGEVSLKILKDDFGCVPDIPHPLEYLEGKGMKITTLKPREREAFRRKLRPVKERWIKKLGKKIYPAALLDLK
jgi:TRAP-type C4-dicarboxylate transport system substrate-binding protein